MHENSQHCGHRLVMKFIGTVRDAEMIMLFVQALGKIPVDVEALGVDYLTIVGHKFYGPRIGALFVRGLDAKATPLVPMLYGGGQESGYRSGCVFNHRHLGTPLSLLTCAALRTLA